MGDYCAAVLTAYRFFSNDRVNEEDILQGHFDATRRRFAASDGPILILHDTTEFGLSLHRDKTRLVEFGRFAVMNRCQRGVGKPETFDFLGFTHYCTMTRRGRFRLGRKPVAKRVNRTLARIDEVLRKRWHHDIWEVGKWLGRVCEGWLNYLPSRGRAGSSVRSSAGCNACGCGRYAGGPSEPASVGGDWSA